MPIVPQSQRSIQQQAAPDARQSIQTDPDVFGAGQGRALQQAGRAIGRVADTTFNIAQDLQQEMNEARVREADTALMRDLDAALYDPERGYMAMRGRNAVDALKQGKINDDLNAVISKHRKGLSDAQARQYNRIATNRLQSTSRLLMNHAMSEGYKYAEETSENRIQALADEAVSSFSDPELVRRNILAIKTEFRGIEARNGWSRATANVHAVKAIMSLHQGVIERMVENGRASDARTYLDQAVQSGEVRGKTIARLEKYTKGATVAQESQTLLDAHYHADRPVGKIVAEISKSGADQEVIDQAVTRVRQRREIDRADEVERRKVLLTDAWNVIEQGGTTDSLTFAMKDALDGPTLAQMDKYAHQKRTGAEPVTDWRLFNDLSIRIAHGDVSDNLYKFRGKLADSEFKALVNDQQAVVTAKRRGEALGEVGTLTQQINSAVSGWKAKYKGHFQRVARSEIAREERANGKSLTYDQRQSVIDRLSINMDIDSWMTFDKPRWKIIGTDMEHGAKVNSFADVPPDDAASLKDYFEAHNIPWTEDDAVDAYSIFLAGDLNRFARFMGHLRLNGRR